MLRKLDPISTVASCVARFACDNWGMRKLLASASLVALLSPVAVSAATAEELAAQIQTLLNQVTALQQQAGSAQTTTTSTSAASAVSECPYTSRVLKRGSTGADVTRLQQFLATDSAIYPDAQITGYYGALTEAAVKRFQCKNKLVCDGTPESTGYGVTGPRTAALLALQCSNLGGGSTGAAAPSGFIRVTPTSGAAPLTVKVEAVVNSARSCAAQQYEINFGDSSQSVYANVPANMCTEQSQTFTHTYMNGGSYGVFIKSGGHQNMVVVNVSGSTSNSNSGDVDGAFSVTAAANGDPLQLTAQFHLASSCARYQLDWGDGSGYASQSQGSCSSGATTKSLSHTYTATGTYTLRLKRGSSLDTVDTISVSIDN